jgi:hypothetical protein
MSFFASPLNTIKVVKNINETILATSSNCVGEKCLSDIENAVATVDQSSTAPSPNSMAWVLLEHLSIISYSESARLSVK